MAQAGVSSVADKLEQLDQLAAQLTSAISEYKAVAESGNDLIARTAVIKTAQQIAFVTKKPEEQWFDQSVQMADLGATRLFMKWKAFDAIPPVGQGTITYEALAEKLDAEVSLVRKLQSPLLLFLFFLSKRCYMC
jgi:hypothetical protein